MEDYAIRVQFCLDEFWTKDFHIINSVCSIILSSKINSNYIYIWFSKEQEQHNLLSLLSKVSTKNKFNIKNESFSL